MKQLEIIDEIYRHDFELLYDTREKNISYIKQFCVLDEEFIENIEEASYYVLPIKKEKDSFKRFIVINSEFVTDFNITLTHEVFHYLYEVMDHVNIPLKHSTEEAYAYFLEYILRKIFRRLEINE